MAISDAILTRPRCLRPSCQRPRRHRSMRGFPLTVNVAMAHGQTDETVKSVFFRGFWFAVASMAIFSGFALLWWVRYFRAYERHVQKRIEELRVLLAKSEPTTGNTL